MAGDELRKKRRRIAHLLRLRRVLERQARQQVLLAGQRELEARRCVLELMQAIAASAQGSREDALAGLQWIELLYSQLHVAETQHAEAEKAYKAATDAHRQAWQAVRAFELLEDRCTSEINARLRQQGEQEVADWFLQRKLRSRRGFA